MTRRAALGSMVLFAFLTVGCSNDGGPVGPGVPTTDGKFKIEFPAAPKQMDKNVGGMAIRIWGYEQSNSEVLMLSVNDLPGVAGADQAQNVLQSAAKGQYQGMGGTLRTSNPTTLQGKYPGVDTEGAAVQGMQAKSRIYLVGSRMYQLLALGDSSFVNSNMTKKFFDSFSIVGE